MSFMFYLRGAVSLLGILLNTLFWFVPVLSLAALKAIPIAALNNKCNQVLDGIATWWIAINNANQRWIGRSQLSIQGTWPESRKEWYMLIANHQSWVDILVLQRLFNYRIPFIKFFLKQQLVWVPFLGIAWWALDFPFMKRYSQEQLAKRPELKGKDMESARRACDKYRHSPVTIMNFLEGTRFTSEKQKAQGGAFQHLLLPKAGGLAFTLSAMEGQLHKLIDVTIVYPDGAPSLWQYVCGRVTDIRVHIRIDDIPTRLLGDYQGNDVFREEFQQWVNTLWHEKDERIRGLLSNPPQ